VFAEERQQLIVGLIYASGRASVTDLAERFSITTETIRRDLAALEAAGSVRRVHGGAVSPDRFSTTEESILERTVQRQPEKTRIAEAALALIPQGLAGSILIDAGSTTEALAELLSARAAGAAAQGTVPASGPTPRPDHWTCPSAPGPQPAPLRRMPSPRSGPWTYPPNAHSPARTLDMSPGARSDHWTCPPVKPTLLCSCGFSLTNQQEQR